MNELLQGQHEIQRCFFTVVFRLVAAVASPGLFDL